jgi:ligand-binding sensor domain-containing protein
LTKVREGIVRRALPVTVAAILLTSHSIARAEDRPLRFTRLAVEDGLSHGWVRAILKDRRGFLWFGTADGLSRFDGTEVRVFNHDPDDPGSLPGTHVTSLLEDDRGQFWVGLRGASNGLARYDRATGRFEHLPMDAAPLPEFAAEVMQILQDRAGRIWVAASSGLYRLNEQDRSFTRVWSGPLDATEILAHMVYHAAEDLSGQLWLACASGLIRLDPETGVHTRWSTVLDGVEIPGPEGVRETYVDERGFVWFVSDGVGLVRLDPSTMRVRRYASGGYGPGRLRAERPRRLTGDGRGTIYVGSEDAGLATLDVRTGVFQHYTPDPDDRESLSAASLWALYIDDQAILWVGTFNGGVSSASPLRRRFGLVTARPDRLTSASVAAVVEDRVGDIWIGTDGGGLHRMNAETRRFTYYRHDAQGPGLASDSVLALLEARDGRIWIGMWDGGLQELDPQTGRFTSFRHREGDASGLANDNVLALAEDSGGNLLVGTFGGGVQLLDRGSGRFTNLSTLFPGAGQGVINTIVEDALGNLWIGHGYAEYVDRETGIVTHHRIEGGRVFAIHQDRLGNVWFGTQSGGLVCLEASSHERRRLTTSDGLPSNRVTSILEAPDGSLWLATARGIARFEDAIHLPETPHFTSFDARDGLQGDEFRQGAEFVSPSGEMFFGGPNGLSYFDPTDVSVTAPAAGAVLTGVEVFGQPVAIGDSGMGLDAALGEARRLVLSATQTMVSFEFVALEFGVFDKTLYRYRLDGFDEGWSPPGRSRTATYTNLAPGDYRLRVAVASQGGPWNEDALSLEIVRRSAIHETRWFWAALLTLTVALGIRWHRVRVARHMRVERSLQARFEAALGEVKTLSGLLPICAWCRRVRNDDGFWDQIEIFVKERSDAEFEQSTCPNCARPPSEEATREPGA